jgi:1-acyl-sn-glycerol-3-phosphate acyltransferase
MARTRLPTPRASSVNGPVPGRFAAGFLAGALLLVPVRLLVPDRERVLVLPRLEGVVRLGMPLTVVGTPSAPPATMATVVTGHDPTVPCCSPMVALRTGVNEPTRRAAPNSVPPLWRVLMWVNRGLVALCGRLVVTGTLPASTGERSILLAANHIGVFDALVLTAACHRAGAAPRFLIAGGIMDAPVLGPALRASGHLRVDRRKSTVVEAFHTAVAALRDGRVAVLVYPEGRISHDPGLWPERGKSGVARLALAAGAPVVPISQWGAHESAYWGTEVVTGWADLRPVLTSWLRSLVRRPTFRVHFGEPVDLDGLTDTRPGDATKARDRIMRAITDGLVPLRPDEPDMPRFHDPTRPTDSLSPWKAGC